MFFVTGCIAFITLALTVFGACNQLRVRKEVNDLSSDEWRRFLRALDMLHHKAASPERFQNNTFTSHSQLVSKSTNVSLFEQLANLHSGRRSEIHK